MSYVTFSRSLARDPLLAEVMGEPVVRASQLSARDARIQGYIGWGRKPSGMRASDAGIRAGKPVAYLEDGFFGYWGHPASGHSVRLAYNLDWQGIYYDARQPSDLEALLGDGCEPDARSRQRAISFCESVRSLRLSKYNHHTSTEIPEHLAARFREADKVCLVVDQTAGDQSIYTGLAKESAFREMLRAALIENPGALVVVKTHPDVLAGKKKSAIGNLQDFPEIVLVGEDVHPHALIEASDRIYVVTSQLGFEALIYKKPVTCFGVPFYAGWGLTDDRGTVPERRATTVSLEKLVYDACFRYAVYLDPDTGKRCEPETVVEWMALQRRHARQRLKEIYAVDFSLWKRTWIGLFAQSVAEKVTFVTDSELDAKDPSVALLIWGAAPAERLRRRFPQRRVFTMEDGFLRSAGLGTDLKRPSSVMIDEAGIYYDATRSSDLERRIAEGKVSEAEKRRAMRLVEQLISKGSTKYNLTSANEAGVRDWIAARRAEGREIVLVPGQVETDASLAYGSPLLRKNCALIDQVREDFPSAALIYKPHPDVVSRNREAGETRSDNADLVVDDISIATLYKLVDKVCVMTSLSGFEALIRGVDVVCYGQPFYSGWGLTDDRQPLARRQSQIDLATLVHHAMLAYPLYINWQTQSFCSAFTLLDQIEQARASDAKPVKMGGYLTKASNFVEALLRRA